MTEQNTLNTMVLRDLARVLAADPSPTPDFATWPAPVMLTESPQCAGHAYPLLREAAKAEGVLG